MPPFNKASQSQHSPIGPDYHHALAIKRTPGTLAFLASNAEVPAAHDAGRLEGMASAFHLLTVARVELKLTEAAISLDELHGNDAPPSIFDELLDNSGLARNAERNGHG